jgi:hypothetical protein
MPMEAPLVAAKAGHSTAGPAVAGEAVRVSDRGGLRGHDRDLVQVARPVLRLVPNISSRVTGCRSREAIIWAIWGKSPVTVR